MSDLSTLFQYAPITAGGFVGINQGNQEIQDRYKQQELAGIVAKNQQEMEQSSQMNPLKLQNQGLINQGLQADLGGKQADSDLKALAAAAKAKTQDSDIQTTLAVNQGKIGEEGAKAASRAQDFLFRAGATLQSVAPLQRAQAFRQMMEDEKMNVNNPQLQNFLLLAQQHPESFPDAVSAYASKLGDTMLAMDPKAQAEMKSSKIRAAAEVQSAGIHAGATVKAAEIGASGRVAAAKARAAATAGNWFEQVKLGKLKASELPIVLEQEAKAADALGDEDKATALRDLARRQAQTNLDVKAPKGETPIPGIDRNKPEPQFGKNPKSRGTGTADDPIILR